MGDLNYSSILLYLDDILVFSSGFEDHLSRLETVSKRLRQHGLKIKPSKCHFLRQECKYLGHVISARGISTNPCKTAAISQWNLPKNKQKLRSFLGLAVYYRRFVHHFSQVAAPLHAMLTKQGFQKKAGHRLPTQDQERDFKER